MTLTFPYPSTVKMTTGGNYLMDALSLAVIVRSRMTKNAGTNWNISSEITLRLQPRSLTNGLAMLALMWMEILFVKRSGQVFTLSVVTAVLETLLERFTAKRPLNGLWTL